MRVTDMRGIDLAFTPFDFDLTLAVLFMHPDGHVYHRYGSRDARGADVWLSLPSFERVLRETLVEHAAYEPRPAGEEPPERVVIEEIPAFQRRDKGECVHCHSLFPAFYEEARDAGTWSEDQRWVYPPPGRIGLDLARDDQALVASVAPDSPAGRAGIRAGDRLLRAGQQRLLTSADLSHVLHEAPGGATTLVLALERDGDERKVELSLAAGWKRGTPAEFAWRPFKWGFTPAPGFGGKRLGTSELARLGLAPDAFAFRVDYLVTWGDNRRYGQEAARAGVREGDVFLSADGTSAFDSVDHFHAWWRLTREPGRRVRVEVLRAGERRALELDVLR